MVAQERDSNFPRVQVGAWHRVKKQISVHAEEVEAVAHREITFESSYMSTASTGIVASTCHRNGCPMSLEFSFISSWSGRASKPLGVDAKDCSANQTGTQCLVNAVAGK